MMKQKKDFTTQGCWAPGVVVSVGRLTSRPWVQFPVEAGRGAVDRRSLGGEGAATDRGGTADGKMVNKYAT